MQNSDPGEDCSYLYFMRPGIIPNILLNPHEFWSLLLTDNVSLIGEFGNFSAPSKSRPLPSPF